MKSVFKTMSFVKFLSTTLLLCPLLTTITLSSIFAAALNTNNPNPNPNTNQKIKNAPLALSEELGCSPTLKALMEPFNKNSGGNKNQAMVYFDPLNLATDDNFGRYREAELKHGRVSMLVVVSCIAQTIAKQKDPAAYFTSGQTPKLGQLLQEYAAAGNGDSNTTWILRLTQVLLVCGILETLLLVQASPQDMPGDYGVGYLGVRDKGKNERSLVSELENGRVAMMTLLYWAILEAVPVSPIPNLFRGLFSSSSAGEQAHDPWDGLLSVLSGGNNDPLAAMMGEIMTFGSDGGGGGMDDVINTAAAAAVDASTAAATSIGNVL